ncbi:MAG TPA: ester cyclase [Methylophilus sp.]|uniref:ester cyclase n=1 Tax=Methylophilus sp. TaxID=29541 RepID=UPI002C8D71AF|nr:ester cyclase [Methylophilus sp.]HSH87470.1 ester cyclase [Methylophilus sp.]
MKLFKHILNALILTTLLTKGTTLMAQDITQQNKQLLADFANAVFVKKDFTQLPQFMQQGYIQHNPLVPQGLSGFQQFFADWFKAVPDWHYQLEKLVAEGDTVWVYGVYSGTQQGDWLGIPATGKHYSIHAVDIFRIENGKLAEHWDVLDTYGLFKQLGVIQ